jgi:hypothetical protein
MEDRHDHLQSRPFSQEEFSRRRAASFEHLSLFVASAEHVILAKLEWAKLGHSQRRIEDAAGILAMRRETLDRPYLDKWVCALDLTEQWDEALRRSA